MSRAVTSEPLYHVGGTMRADAPSYVKRQADVELLQHAAAGDFCYVLTPRQMGKSSLMVRTAAQLKSKRIRSVLIDLTSIIEHSMTPDTFYAGLVNNFVTQLALPVDLTQWWQNRALFSSVKRFSDFVADVVLRRVKGRIVIFIDEIDSMLNCNFSDDVFAAVRAFYNNRASNAEFRRLTFVLLGVASPSDLIKDRTRTLFNIGHRIELTDFTFAEARLLARFSPLPVGTAEQVLQRVLDWTGGHPYLTQKVCAALVERRHSQKNAQGVDALIHTLFFTDARWEDTNLAYVRTRLLEDKDNPEALLTLYGRIRSGEPILDDERSPVHTALKLSGIVKVFPGGWLRPRNKIYAQVFDLDWVHTAQPSERLQQVTKIVEQLRNLPATYANLGLAVHLHQRLHAIHGYEQQADALLATFWERRALVLAKESQDEAMLLCYLKALTIHDSDHTRREVARLIEYQTTKESRLTGIPRIFLSYVYEDVEKVEEIYQALSNAGFEPWMDIHSAAPEERWLAHIKKAVWRSDILLLCLSTHSLKTAGYLLREIREPLKTWQEKPTDHTPPILVLLEACEVPDNLRGFPVATVFDKHGIPQLVDVVGANIRRQEEKTKPRGQEPTQPILLPGPASCLLTHNSQIPAMVLSPDGRMLAASGDDRTVHIWNLDTAQLISAPIVHPSPVDALAFSPDSHMLVTASLDGTTQLWEAQTGKPVGPPLEYHNRVQSLAFSPDGRWLATGGWDHTVRVWDVQTGKPLGQFLGHQDRIQSLAFSADGRWLATGSWDKTARVWEVDTGKQGKQLMAEREICTVALSPDGRTFFIGTGHGTAQFLGVQTGSGVLIRDGRYGGTIRAAAYSPDGRAFVLANKHAVQLWDPEFRDLRAIRFLRTPCGALRFLPDESRAIQVALLWTKNSVLVQHIHFDVHDTPPIQGEPQTLLHEWSQRLEAGFDEDGNLWLGIYGWHEDWDH